MGYDLHITRRENWHDEEGANISLPDWLAYIEADSEMRLDGYAEADLDDGSVLRSADPGMAVWVAHPEHGRREGMAWLWLNRGNVQAKNPDEDTRRKMWRIAQSLGAKLQGDEGEFYDASGSMVQASAAVQGVEPSRKPWWRIFKRM